MIARYNYKSVVPNFRINKSKNSFDVAAFNLDKISYEATL